MKILIVCSYREYSAHTDYVAPFIYEQVQSLEKQMCETRYVIIKGGGVKAYIRGALNLIRIAKKWQPDIIHAHSGFCGFIANLQRSVPVVTTYHGSDINVDLNRFISRFAIHFSAYNIFVSQKLIDLVNPKRKYTCIPCGVDLDRFYSIEDKNACREKLNLTLNRKYVLFSKMFCDPVKNYALARRAINKLHGVELIEFVGYSREASCLLMNACDAVIMTSFMEGSPQFIKEAMACSCPIVSVDVGDVKEIISGTKACFVTSYDATDIADKLQQALDFAGKTDGRSRIMQFDTNEQAKKIIDIYNSITRNKHS